jgi:outer membrane protein
MFKRLCLVSLLGFALPLTAAQAIDVGYIDMQVVVEKSKLGAKVQEKLRKEFEARTKPIEEEEHNLRQADASLAKEAALMSKDQLEKKEADLKKRFAAWEKVAAPLQQELVKAKQEGQREVLVSAQKAADTVAKQKKIGMVVERNQGGIVFLDKSLDITDEVIKQMDASTK